MVAVFAAADEIIAAVRHIGRSDNIDAPDAHPDGAKAWLPHHFRELQRPRPGLQIDNSLPKKATT